MFVVEDAEDLGMSGMNVVQVQLFFSLIYDNVLYPLALIDWFKRGGCDPVTGMWVVHPNTTDGVCDRTVLHLETFLHAAHLIPIYGNGCYDSSQKWLSNAPTQHDDEDYL
jgi:hypothetical protein